MLNEGMHFMSFLRRGSLITLLLFCWLLLSTHCGQAGTGDPTPRPISGPIEHVPGKLLYAKYSEFWTFEPSTKALAKLASFSDLNYVGWPSLSPDGQRVVFNVYRPGNDPTDPGGTDIYVIQVDGSDPQPVAIHDTPGGALHEPAWSGNGKTIFFTNRAPQRPVVLERIQVDGTGRSVVVPGGFSPSVSPDGTQLVYLTTDPQTQLLDLWIAKADGGDARRLAGGDDGFAALATPRFSPDGSTIAFNAAGGPGVVVPTPEPLTAPAGRSPFAPPVAYAHGIPSDIWTIESDGSGLTRITDLFEDFPVPVWSPDGKWLAIVAELGIYVLDADGKNIHRLADEFTTGGATWLP